MLHLFVYGTLKPGEAYFAKYCAPYQAEATPALTQGCLYHLPQGYPALTEGDRWVTGTLLRFPDAAVLTAMDAFEDYDPTQPPTANLYVRQQRPVFTLAQAPLGTAWMYIMARDRVTDCGGILIPEGNWSRQQWFSISPDSVTPP